MSAILYCVFIFAAEPQQPFLVPSKMCDPPCQRLKLTQWNKKHLERLRWENVDQVLACVVYS